MKRKMSATGSLRLHNNSDGVPPFLSPLLLLCIFLYAYMHPHIYKYRNQNILQDLRSRCPLGQVGCVWPGSRPGSRAGQHGRIIEEINKPLLCVCWHISDPHLNITLIFIPAHRKLLPFLNASMNVFLAEKSKVLSAAKVIEISMTSVHKMPCTLTISFIINIRCQLILILSP